jgi:hypothetical protein
MRRKSPTLLIGALVAASVPLAGRPCGARGIEPGISPSLA